MDQGDAKSKSLQTSLLVRCDRCTTSMCVSLSILVPAVSGAKTFGRLLKVVFLGTFVLARLVVQRSGNYSVLVGCLLLLLQAIQLPGHVSVGRKYL